MAGFAPIPPDLLALLKRKLPPRIWKRFVFLASDDPKRAPGCLIWKGARNEKGYGVVKWKGKRRRVHRVVYECIRGIKPKRDRELLHSCDTPACSMPTHLRPGTTRQNARDRHAKGRTRGCCEKRAA